ncbi:MAG TPA: M20/M25/M40 family metallo-hydrolase [Hyphomicrobiaceae bacterium]|nr:M20/M25/M40 family metallo-hydrolase [Hyphomicrobiaceae bacterium]
MTALAAERKQLLGWIDAEKDELVSFLARFVRAASPNPPGDTRVAAGLLADWLAEAGLPARTIAPRPEMPNLVASFEGRRPGRHLVLNGHIDVYPCDDGDRWARDPWGGEIADGRIWGRGVSDMKNGTVALLFAFGWLNRLRKRLPGRVTFTAVSDEETGGTWGAKYLVDNHPEVLGDCVLNAEPGAPTTIRFGEKGILRVAIIVETAGCHGAYTHKSPSATRIAARIAGELGAVDELSVSMDPAVERALDEAAEEIDRVHVTGAAAVIKRFTMNLGVVRGGVKMNMLPGKCRLECDVRIPVGEAVERAMSCIREIAARHPHARVEVMGLTEPNWSDPAHPMVGHLREACVAVRGVRPFAITSLGASDTRLWRMKGIPAFTYGTTANNVAMPDEHTDIEEWIGVVKTLTLAAHAYLHTEAVS